MPPFSIETTGVEITYRLLGNDCNQRACLGMQHGGAVAELHGRASVLSRQRRRMLRAHMIATLLLRGSENILLGRALVVIGRSIVMRGAARWQQRRPRLFPCRIGGGSRRCSHPISPSERHHGMAMRRQRLQRGMRVILPDGVMHRGRVMQLHRLGVVIRSGQMMGGGLFVIMHGVALTHLVCGHAE